MEKLHVGKSVLCYPHF